MAAQSAAPALSGLGLVESLVASVQGQEGLGLVGCVDQIIAELESMGWAHTQRLLPRQVGVHPLNRDGMGVNTDDVHGLGRDILAMGWSWLQVASAVCIEEEPGSEAIVKFNEELVAGCDNLAPVDADMLRYGSLSCGHTNMFLRCLWAGVESRDEALAESGHLSVDKLARRDAQYARAVREGIEWKVLSHRAHSIHGLLTLIQRARNAPQAAGRPENEVQVMLRMHSLAVQAQRRELEPDWSAIRRSVAHSNPPCINDLPDLAVFVAVLGGGMDGTFLHDLMCFHRQFVKTRLCSIRGGFFRALAECDLEAPYLKMAILKAQYVCPPNKVNRYKEPTLFTPADLSRSSKHKAAKAYEAESLLRTLRRCLRSAGLGKLDHNMQVRVLARLDTMCARLIFDKQESSKVRMQSLEHVARTALQDLHVSHPSSIFSQ